MRKARIAVLFGGTSSERAVSLDTGKNILKNLDRKKYISEPVVIGRNGKWKMRGKELAPPDALKLAKKRGIEAVFVALHGKYGEDGTVQGLLEFLGIPYTGSGVLASALAMDKVRSSELFAFHGLLVPKFSAFSKEDRRKISWAGKFPVVVKPADGGSSVGVSIIKRKSEFPRAIKKAFAASEIVMLQEYIRGNEVTCGVLDVDGKPLAFPPTQIIPQKRGFFDYHAKYVPGASREVTPPELPREIIRKIQNAALLAHRVLGCSGLSRTDMIVKNGKIYMLETNTIPGMTETSLCPQAAKAAGIGLPELLDKIIQGALRRNTR